MGVKPIDPGEWWGRRKVRVEPPLYAPELPDPRTCPHKAIMVYEVTGEPQRVGEPPPAQATNLARVVLYRRASGFYRHERVRGLPEPVTREFWIYGWSDEPGEVAPPPYRGRL